LLDRAYALMTAFGSGAAKYCNLHVQERSLFPGKKFHSAGRQGGIYMYKSILHRWRHDVRPFTAAKNSRRARVVLLLLGCAFFAAACADDSLDNKSQGRGRHHGGRRGGGQEENSAGPTATPGIF
jgi:hypothetical protein